MDASPRMIADAEVPRAFDRFPALRMPWLMVVVPVKVLAPESVRVPVPVLIRLKLFSFVPDPPSMPPKLLFAVVLRVRLTVVALPLTMRLEVALQLMKLL